MALVTLEDVKRDPEVEAFVRQGNEHLGALGYTEHGHRHLGLVASISHNVLARLGYPERLAELASIAGYLHDIGNVISRQNHGQAGALLSYNILRRLGMDAGEMALVLGAIGNHEEEYGQAVNPVAAALILADKSDVHRSRVRNRELATFDLHDRVNYAVEHSFLRVDEKHKTITLELEIDLEISKPAEYFEIFLTRMMMCRRAAAFLSCQFGLVINQTRLL
ncbi:metal dependent phosphohydrolase [Thermanaeromonas toyohensis ToBE]|uniref:Metal dependent phosphohydrolase n=1 Tax=Thermanaeromonas toyohensis ToBE TaxID=698762 RepID=A0A1W1VZQ0_9FIRM|nr:HD domain-containing protein [Thermanaeromonas toyohensis]SMB98852.1 metal dependent phosphohydrolase [Thermanaeromonas toyohensis ToBE]